MRKFVLFLFLIFTVPFTCFAGIWMETKPALVNINLANPESLYNGTDGKFVEYQTISRSEHCEQEMIGLIGIDGSDSTGKTYEVTFEFVGGNGNRWMYSSLDDPNYAIPFGIDFVSQKRPSNGGPDENYEMPNGLGHVIHTGYQGGSTPESDYSGAIILQVPDGYKGVWLDMVLVIPFPIDGVGFYGKSNLYQATINVKVKEIETGKTEIFPLVLTGYYGVDKEPQKSAVYFSVVPNGEGTSLNLSDIIQEDIIIGGYTYMTEAVKTTNTVASAPKYSLFVSSSQDPYNNDGGAFALELLGEYDDSSAEAEGLITSVQFQIGLKSSYASDTAWFEGSDKISSYNSNFVNSYVMHAKTINTENKLPLYSEVFLDRGDIIFSLRDNNNIDSNKVVAGRYSETIYIHLVSNY